MAGKYYVVWEGLAPGIYFSWEECQQQVAGVPNARYKAFKSKEDAIMAYRGDTRNELDMLRAIVENAPLPYRLDAIAVDGACSGNPGPVEYRGVDLSTGKEIFRVGPLPGGTNNIGEYLALVHALALLHNKGDRSTAVYTDSRNALAWFRNKSCRTTIGRTPSNRKIFELIERADKWLQTHTDIPNPVLKWETEKWGEIPADFGRK